MPSVNTSRRTIPDEWKERLDNEVIPILDTRRTLGRRNADTFTARKTNYQPCTILSDLQDEQGRAFRRAAMVTDITERKRAEETLRKSEERFRSYFEQGLMGMAVYFAG